MDVAAGGLCRGETQPKKSLAAADQKEAGVLPGQKL